MQLNRISKHLNNCKVSQIMLSGWKSIRLDKRERSERIFLWPLIPEHQLNFGHFPIRKIHFFNENHLLIDFGILPNPKCRVSNNFWAIILEKKIPKEKTRRKSWKMPDCVIKRSHWKPSTLTYIDMLFSISNWKCLKILLCIGRRKWSKNCEKWLKWTFFDIDSFLNIKTHWCIWQIWSQCKEQPSSRIGNENFPLSFRYMAHKNNIYFQIALRKFELSAPKLYKLFWDEQGQNNGVLINDC